MIDNSDNVPDPKPQGEPVEWQDPDMKLAANGHAEFCISLGSYVYLSYYHDPDDNTEPYVWMLMIPNQCPLRPGAGEEPQPAPTLGESHQGIEVDAATALLLYQAKKAGDLHINPDLVEP
jgi:hypothetical protein